MSEGAVVSDLTKEVTALKAFRTNTLPVSCIENTYSEGTYKLLRACDRVTKLARLHKNNNNNNEDMPVQPYDSVREFYDFPFDFYPFQERTANALAPLPRAGHYLDMGLGKTVISLACALYQTMHMGCDRIVIIVPPTLLTGWSRFISTIKDKETGPVSSLVYRGNPKERLALDLSADIVIVGIQIFKKDYARFQKAYEGERVVVIVDEAHALKNVGSDNHAKVRDFAEGRHLMLLTGTPINSPGDGYAMVKLVAPSIYRNQHQFNKIHVAERDFFDQVIKWRNLDLLRENLAVNSVRLLKEEVIADMPPITYHPMYYDLDPAHLKLYRKLAEEQLLPFAEGGKLDATSVQALIHAMGQLVCNWGHFAQDESKVSAGFQLIDEVLDELGDGKLILFSNYKMTNRAVIQYLKKYNPVAIYGEIGAADRDRAIDKFVQDPTCRVFIGNPRSAGYGVDGLQKVSSTVMYLEPPITPTDFNQSKDRAYRIGQTKPVTVKICSAVGTLQERQLEALMNKEDLVQTLTRGYQSLRKALGLK